MTDGHARHELLPFEIKIVERLPEIFRESEVRSQTEIEKFFLGNFFRLAGQTPIEDDSFLNFSASTSTLLVGKILKEVGTRIYAPVPAFDNLINMLKWLGHEPIPYRDGSLHVLETCRNIDEKNAVIWVFTPNNPTGSSLSKSEFVDLVTCAQKTDTILVFDFCFRFFSDSMNEFDQYEILKSSGAKFFAIEDTGKTWNTSDTKVSPIICSHHFKKLLFEAHDNLLLNVSPFHLLHLGHVFEGASVLGLADAVWKRFSEKRAAIVSSIEHLPFVEANISGAVPLVWLKEREAGAAQAFVARSLQAGIHVLPGNQFFWNEDPIGKSFVRLPLARTDSLLWQATNIFRQIEM
jgi:aspartate/methionine/tyrosine aminotransferase